MKNKFNLLFLSLGMLLVSCKKDETVTPATPTTKQLLTANTWKVTNYATTSTDTSATNELSKWNSDIKATTLYVTYNANGTYAYSDSSDYGAWELSGDKTIIYAKGTPDQSIATIDKLTTSDFVLSYEWKVNNSLTVKVAETSTKK